MKNNEIIIILSERGKDLAIVGVLKYRNIGLRKKGDLLKWQCANNDFVQQRFILGQRKIVLQSNEQYYYDG